MSEESSIVRLLGERDVKAPPNLPRPAVKMAYRLAQLARASELVTAQVIIVDGAWFLQYNGRNERLGT